MPRAAPARSLAHSRASAALLLAAVVLAGWIPMPHVFLRVPLALAAVWGLWRRRAWGVPIAFLATLIWLQVTAAVAA